MLELIIDSIGSVNLLKWLILLDGLFCALHFIKDYTIFRFKTKREYRDFAERYREPYKSRIVTRYIFYCIVYLIYQLVNLIFYITDTTNNLSLFKVTNFICCIGMVIPDLQYIMLKYARSFEESMDIFVKYLCSRILITTIQSLDSRIEDINNYHVFIIYQYMSFEYIMTYIQSYVMIYILYFLRKSEHTYYYYKAIKLAYYYKTGFLFNIVDDTDAIYIINMIIRDKRWKDIAKMDIVNAMYSLIIKLKFEEELIWVLHWKKFIALWNIICFLQVFSYRSKIILSIVSMIFIIRQDITKIKNSYIVIVVYALLIYGYNDMLISIVVFTSEQIKYIVNEMYFFYSNYQNIYKMIKYYKNKTRYTLDQN